MAIYWIKVKTKWLKHFYLHSETCSLIHVNALKSLPDTFLHQSTHSSTGPFMGSNTITVKKRDDRGQQTNAYKHRLADRQTDKHTVKHRQTHTDKHRQTSTYRQTDRQTSTNRQTNTQTTYSLLPKQFAESGQGVTANIQALMTGPFDAINQLGLQIRLAEQQALASFTHRRFATTWGEKTKSHPQTYCASYDFFLHEVLTTSSWSFQAWVGSECRILMTVAITVWTFLDQFFSLFYI